MGIRPPAPYDSYVNQTLPNNNYQAATSLLLQRTAGAHRRVFFRFDLPAVQSKGIIVQRAKLTLYFSTAFVTGTATITRCLKAWIVDQITWNEWIGGSAWDGVGVEDPMNYDKSRAIYPTLPSSTGHQSYDIKLLVQDAYDLRSNELNICFYPELGDAAEFWAVRSAEAIDVTQRPVLDITIAGGSGYFASAATGQVHPVSGW